MKSTSRFNTDSTDTAASAPAETAVAEAAPVAATAPAEKAKEPHKESHKPAPATVPPQENPAVPYDAFHGHGGRFALVDGKRVPIDDEDKPLPLDKDGKPVRPAGN
jgi:hypothetical protein